VNVQYLNLHIFAEILAKLGDIYIHASGIEVVIVNPYRLKGKIAFQYLVTVTAEKLKELRLLCCQLMRLAFEVQQLFGDIKSEFTYSLMINRSFSLPFGGTTEDGFDTVYQLLH
jgi:hypothetical protein